MFILVRCVTSSNISLYYFQVCLEDESDFPSSFESSLEHFGAISIKLLLNIHKGKPSEKKLQNLWHPANGWVGSKLKTWFLS